MATTKYRQLMLVGDIYSFTPYGVNQEEINALKAAFLGKPVGNGKKTTGQVIEAITLLGALSYQVVTTTFKTNTNEVLWILQKQI